LVGVIYKCMFLFLVTSPSDHERDESAMMSVDDGMCVSYPLHIYLYTEKVALTVSVVITAYPT